MSSSESEDIKNEEASAEEEVQSEEEENDVAEDDSDDEVESDEADGESDDENPSAKELDVNASATESDEDDEDESDDEVDDDEDVPKPKAGKVAISKSQKVERITDKVKERYQKRQGRQLYIRFPAKLPEKLEDFKEKVNALSELIVDSHKPRQKHARFCLVDFASTEDRDIALKKLSKTSKETKIVVSIPKTDSEDFIATIVEKKVKQMETKRAKNLLRKESRKSATNREFVSTISVLNIPKSASTAQIKELFPDAVDIQVKAAHPKFEGTQIATITLPSSGDAKKNVKRKLELGGNKLIIRFNIPKKKKNKNNKSPNKNNKSPKKKTPAQPKGPLAPQQEKNKKQANGGSPKKEPQSPGKKRLNSNSENGTDEVIEKKAKVEVSKAAQKPNKQQGKGKKNFPPKKANPPANKNVAGGKPNNKQNKQKKQPQKKGKAAAK